MKTTLSSILLVATLLLLTPLTAIADHDGRPHDDKCGSRENTCTDVSAGQMSCMPESGEAEDFGVVVGAADSGTFKLEATGVNHAASATSCLFEIRVHADQMRFNEGWTVGLLAPYGGATGVSSSPCASAPGDACTAVATFSWWRAQHGVTFDVPYTLHVNGVEVAHGEVHYYDPPMFETVYGGPFVLP